MTKMIKFLAGICVHPTPRSYGWRLHMLWYRATGVSCRFSPPTGAASRLVCQILKDLSRSYI